MANPRCAWVVGSPGCGKSHLVRIALQKTTGAVIAFKQGQGKWFPYNSAAADIIVFEDIGPAFFKGASEGTGPEMLKIWGDRYKFPVECKGG